MFECVHADGHGDADVITHHCLWSHLPAQPLPAQQLWDPVLPLLLVPAGNGLVCLPVLHPHPQSEAIIHNPAVCAQNWDFCPLSPLSSSVCPMVASVPACMSSAVTCIVHVRPKAQVSVLVHSKLLCLQVPKWIILPMYVFLCLHVSLTCFTCACMRVCVCVCVSVSAVRFVHTCTCQCVSEFACLTAHTGRCAGVYGKFPPLISVIVLPLATLVMLLAGKHCCKPWIHGVHSGLDHASGHHFWLPLHA